MRSSSFFPLLLVLLVIGGIGLLIFWEPERQTVTSDDGFLQVTGLVRESQPFLITEQDSIEPFTSKVYTIEPSGIILETFAELTFDTVLDGEGIYRFNETALMWSLQTQSAVFETDQLGDFGIAPLFSIEAPEFASLREEVQALAPENVVGYDIVVGAEIAGELFYLSDKGDQGGCGGVYALGSRAEQSRLEQSAVVPLNGVDQLITFVYVADWQIQDTGGCGGDDLISANVVIE